MTLSRFALSRRALGVLFTSSFATLALGVALTSDRASIAAEEPAKAAEAKEEKWVSLFNGKDLEGWTPKIRYHDLGDNYANTYRVEDGVLKVRYDGYEKFNETFGHLYYKTPYSHYRFRCEYRFVGEQCPGGPGWAIRNSGVMVHGQDPATIGKDQDFPVSIEVQFLGGDGKNPRATGNLCTPGTNVVMGGQLLERHCTNSKSKTYPIDEWVKCEIEAHGAGKIKHFINGELVLEYEQPQYDPKDGSAKKLIKDPNNLLITGGTISLQSESHPCEFRNIEILVLDE